MVRSDTLDQTARTGCEESQTMDYIVRYNLGINSNQRDGRGKV